MTRRWVPVWVVNLLVVAVATADVWATMWQLLPFYEVVVDDGWLVNGGEPGAYRRAEIIAEHGMWWGLYFDDRVMLTLLAVAVAALWLRRRWPLLVFLATLPPLVWLPQTAASLIALYTLASLSRRRLLLGGCALLLAVSAVWAPGLSLREQLDEQTLIWFGQGLAQAAAAVFLGQLVQARRDLSLRLVEISQARDHEQQLVTQSALAAERAQLAREMHDVVSHQVSLIAVRAGALQVHTADPEVKEAARTIRVLSVQTLDELRHMVRVLRASSSAPTELAPQPTLDQLGQLVNGSGVAARLELDSLPDVDSATQRAVYRTVQEALTNARKHAPGASVLVRVGERPGALCVEVSNGPATRPVVPLPGSEQGLLGLAQRAALLGGRLEYGPAGEGGWRVRAWFPVAPANAPAPEAGEPGPEPGEPGSEAQPLLPPSSR